MSKIFDQECERNPADLVADCQISEWWAAEMQGRIKKAIAYIKALPEDKQKELEPLLEIIDEEHGAPPSAEKIYFDGDESNDLPF